MLFYKWEYLQIKEEKQINHTEHNIYIFYTVYLFLQKWRIKTIYHFNTVHTLKFYVSAIVYLLNIKYFFLSKWT